MTEDEMGYETMDETMDETHKMRNETEGREAGTRRERYGDDGIWDGGDKCSYMILPLPSFFHEAIQFPHRT